ncbi:hypothetical protein [Vibrio chagasii]|uniref:hypothetical protein n=1 Tax=Vibrio chagasii TaxID=170679 RepID=UPI0037363050
MNNRFELLGLPCSGKSYYLKNCHATSGFSTSCADFRSKRSRVLSVLLMMIKYYRVTFLCMVTFKYVSFKLWKCQFIGVFRYFSRIYDTSYPQQGISILEEGIMQSLWGLVFMMNHCDSSHVLARKIYQNIPKSSFSDVKYISAPKQVILERNSLREKKTRFSYFVDKNNIEIIDRSRIWMVFILKKLRDDEKVSIKFNS